jgi:hypothetical protein
MDKVELVCVSCHKVDPGTGVWSASDSPPGDTYRESLCPDCCYLRFPQFYSDFRQPTKSQRSFKGLLSSVAGLFKLQPPPSR